MKPLLLLLAVLGLATGLWAWQQPASLRQAAQALGAGAAPLSAALAPAGQPDAAPVGGVRKCVQDGQVLYTDGNCPAGSRPQQMTDAALTVLPAAPRPTPAASAGGAPTGTLPHVRQLLGTPQDGSLKDKRMDDVINR